MQWVAVVEATGATGRPLEETGAEGPGAESAGQKWWAEWCRVLARSQQGIASVMRLRGGGWGEGARGGDRQGRAGKRPWGGGDGAGGGNSGGGSGGKAKWGGQRSWGGEWAGRGANNNTSSGKQLAASGGDDAPQGAEEWCRVTNELAAAKPLPLKEWEVALVDRQRCDGACVVAWDGKMGSRIELPLDL